MALDGAGLLASLESNLAVVFVLPPSLSLFALQVDKN